MRGFLSLVVLCTLLFAGMSGCAAIENVRDYLAQESTEAPADPFNGKTQLTAELFIQSVAISSAYPLEIRVAEDKIFVNTVSYKKAGKMMDPEITYEQLIAMWAEVQDPSGHITEVLEKIQNSESCYVLEAEDYASTGRSVAIYEVGGMYYFVTSLNGIAIKIHAAPIDK